MLKVTRWLPLGPGARREVGDIFYGGAKAVSGASLTSPAAATSPQGNYGGKWARGCLPHPPNKAMAVWDPLM